MRDSSAGDGLDVVHHARQRREPARMSWSSDTRAGMDRGSISCIVSQGHGASNQPPRSRWDRAPNPVDLVEAGASRWSCYVYLIEETQRASHELLYRQRSPDGNGSRSRLDAISCRRRDISTWRCVKSASTAVMAPLGATLQVPHRSVSPAAGLKSGRIPSLGPFALLS
jgi:hypothetical protein